MIRPGYTYDLLTLDHPVCFLGDNAADPHGSRVALVPTTSEQQLRALQGRHVQVHGSLTSPDNGNQPPESMLMFDPVVRSLP